MKKIAIILVAAVMSLSGTAVAKDWSTIRIATEGAYKPWNYTDSAGNLIGYEIDLYADLCARMGVECTLIPTAWKGIIPGLEANRYDAIMAAMNSTPKRRKAITFSRNYASAPRYFYVTPDSEIQALDTGAEMLDLDNAEMSADQVAKLAELLGGKSVGVQVNTTFEDFLRKYLADAVEIRTYDTQENLDLDLESGRVDIGMGSSSYLTPAIADGKPLIVLGPGITGDVYGSGQSVGVRKEDQALADMFSVAIDAAITDGTIAELTTKWFGYSLAPAE
jgi:octopine/nopaline transport system substrate-binding protein